jgi:DNA-binding GntR family transcriptional regulator
MRFKFTNQEKGSAMIDHNSSIPMYIQISKKLSDAIYQGEYSPGDKLPSENNLCRQFDVSRITVRQAMNLLIQQGLAFSVHGKGTFVKKLNINHELNEIISFSSVLQQKGLKGHTRIQSFCTDYSDEKIRNLLGGEVSNLNLIGYAAQTPVVYYRSFFKPELGQRMWRAAQQAELTDTAFSTYDLYSTIGVNKFRVEQNISAINADTELAHILDLPKKKALIVLESMYYASDGTPLEYKLGHYHSDIYSFHIQRKI